MSKSLTKIAVILALAVAVVAAVGFGCWQLRYTEAKRSATAQQVEQSFEKAKTTDAKTALLQKLASEKVWRIYASGTFPWMELRHETVISQEAIAGHASRVLNGSRDAKEALTPAADKLLAFADSFVKTFPPPATNTPPLRAQRLLTESIDQLRASGVVQLVQANDLDGACNKLKDVGRTGTASRMVRSAFAAAFREMPAESLVANLRKLEASPFFTSADFVASLSEEQIIRFGGDGTPQNPPNVKAIRDMLAYTEALTESGRLTKGGAEILAERRLDGFFLVNDFDSAIAFLEKGGLPNRTPTWCKATAAKLRAHKAMEAKNWPEATKQMLAFIDFMRSDEQKDFEECDPSTGILYSREWVIARNYLRCAEFSKNSNDDAKAAEFRVLAGTFFKTALEKAAEEESSLKALSAEMKENNFPVELPAKKPAEAKPAAPKPAENKPAEAKPAEAKPAEAKPVEAKPAEAKPAENKPAEKPASK